MESGVQACVDCLNADSTTSSEGQPKATRKPRAPKGPIVRPAAAKPKKVPVEPKINTEIFCDTVPGVDLLPLPETKKRKRAAPVNNSSEESQPVAKKPRQTKAKPVEKEVTLESLHEMLKQHQSIFTQFMDDTNRVVEEIKAVQALRNKHGF